MLDRGLVRPLAHTAHPLFLLRKNEENNKNWPVNLKGETARKIGGEKERVT